MILLFVVVATMNMYAQLVVDSLGRVGIGTESPRSTLSVGSAGDTITGIYCSPSNKVNGIHISNYTSLSSGTCGLKVYGQNTTGNCYGASTSIMGSSSLPSSQCVIGLRGTSSRAYTAIGVLGGRLASAVEGVKIKNSTTVPSGTTLKIGN